MKKYFFSDMGTEVIGFIAASLFLSWKWLKRRTFKQIMFVVIVINLISFGNMLYQFGKLEGVKEACTAIGRCDANGEPF